MSHNRLRWGILGTARINRRLIPALAASPRSTLVAVASRDLARGQAFAADWAVGDAVEGYAPLLARDDIDAVYIPLPNSEHVGWTLAAIDAGKHVLCEKPLALDPADVDRIADAATRRGVIVEEGFMYRHEPLTARVTALVADGAVGAVRAIVSGFTYTQSRPHDVRLDSALGGGALWDVGCYPVSYASLLMGRPPEMAVGVAQWTPNGIDHEFMGTLRYPGGAMVSCYAGFRAAYRTWLDILGSEGALRVPNPFKPGPLETLELERLGAAERIEVTGSPELFVREVAAFERAVLDGAPPVVSLGDSRRTAVALAALLESARSGAPVRLAPVR